MTVKGILNLIRVQAILLTRVYVNQFLYVLDGGTGVDTVNYNNEDEAIVSTLVGGASTVNIGGVNSDTLTGIENIYGGTNR